MQSGRKFDGLLMIVLITSNFVTFMLSDPSTLNVLSPTNLLRPLTSPLTKIKQDLNQFERKTTSFSGLLDSLTKSLHLQRPLTSSLMEIIQHQIKFGRKTHSDERFLDILSLITSPLNLLRSFTSPFVEILQYRNKFKALLPSDIQLITSPDIECDLDVPQMIQYAGYDCEVHRVMTKDKYILELHRILNKKRGINTQIEPVLLMHGLGSSSADWVNNKAHQGLAYMLADLGYDVWLGNVRGNTYSAKHQTWDTNGKKFWSFSWDEMAKYDITAKIDYILDVTNKSKLNYIGWSMGTTMCFAMLSSLVEYNKKIRVFIALGPATDLANIKSLPFKVLAKLRGVLKIATNLINLHKILSNDNFVKFFAKTACAVTATSPNLCELLINGLAGIDQKGLNTTRLPVYFSHIPATISMQTLYHFFQTHNNKEFQYYDWGPAQNFEKYGQFAPPAYNLTRITAPVVLISSPNDLLTVPKDAKRIAAQLPSHRQYCKINKVTRNHITLVWGINENDSLYQDIINCLANNSF